MQLDLLDSELEKMGLSQIKAPLLTYVALLLKWNKAYNLTAVSEPEIINKHLLDSLAILPWLQGTRIVDVGTGAGFPGMPLAIANPDLALTLLDSCGKKIRFLREVKRALCLDNVTIVESRAENYHPDINFDTVTSRALSSINQLIAWTKHLLHPHGIWLAMKGPEAESELANVTYRWHVERYTLPNAHERCCILIEKDLS
jgi:16S rRNA (guanine527-N7)-methyltransferase